VAKKSRGRNSRSQGSRGSRGRNDYQRTDRVGELIRQIVSDELTRIDDDELGFVTVSGVEVDSDLFRAHVYLSSLDLDDADISAVHKHAPRVRKAVGQQARLRKTPEIVFQLDPGLVAGERIDELLRSNEVVTDSPASAEEE